MMIGGENYRVWWITNPPGEAEYYPVNTINEAINKLDELERRDVDATDNVGGLQVFDSDYGDWAEYEDEEGRNIYDIMDDSDLENDDIEKYSIGVPAVNENDLEDNVFITKTKGEPEIISRSLERMPETIPLVGIERSWREYLGYPLHAIVKVTNIENGESALALVSYQFREYEQHKYATINDKLARDIHMPLTESHILIGGLHLVKIEPANKKEAYEFAENIKQQSENEHREVARMIVEAFRQMGGGFPPSQGFPPGFSPGSFR